MRVGSLRTMVVGSALVLALLGGCEREADGPWLTALTPETHEANFPIGTGDHAVDCSACHGGTSSFRQFACQAGECHPAAETSPRHQGALGYEWVSTSCRACHPTGSADGAQDHRAFFPIATGDKHAGVPCAFCHQDPGSRHAVSCAVEGCHGEVSMQQRHEGVDGYTWTTDGCLSCHPKAERL